MALFHLLLVLLLHLLRPASASPPYTAAYVEHHATSACGSGSCGAETKRKNVASYVAFVAAAAAKHADIIAFPEYGITGFSSLPLKDWVQGGYTETIPPSPKPGAPKVVPCTSLLHAFSGAPSVVALSCAAQAHGVAIVANLVDYDATGKGALYNTDVALDSDGAFLARYHKLNLWGEGNIDVPGDCPEASFRTVRGLPASLPCAHVPPAPPLSHHPALHPRPCQLHRPERYYASATMPFRNLLLALYPHTRTHTHTHTHTHTLMHTHCIHT